ncbi:MAG: DoxX family protein [Betaproteobacteria bacterium]|nr:DoxX family protein [Betaproteobacteria bacterium]
MEATWVYLLARLCTCVLWGATGIYALFHYRETVAKMAKNHVPWPTVMLVPVLIMKFGGTLMLLTNQFVWLAALVWSLYLIPVNFMFHYPLYDKQGQFDFQQMINFTKNLSLIGGLLALALLDPDKPRWFLDLLQ